MEGFSLEHINLGRKSNRDEIARFLEKFDLRFDDTPEFTVVLRDQEGALAGTGSFDGEILRNIAVDDSLQGGGLTAAIVSALIQEAARRGTMHYFIFTRPAKAFLFESLGFKEIVKAEPYAALLESGIGSVESYCESVAEEAKTLPQQRAAIVMNANPFTKGHLALIEKAASENGGVIVFAVSEDKSAFPTEDRLLLMRQGTTHIPNVVIVPSGKYIISAATFPTYFTKEDERAAAQACLDITLFARQIAPRLGITARYAGEEPYCAVTAAYNQAMLDILPKTGVTVHVLPREKTDGAIISASAVREMIRQGKMEELAAYVPQTTLAYLNAPENISVLEKIRSSDSRH
ncbi:MAG: [Citrate [pro-3S]-lyase] ligase [Desulfovibrio sp.]